MTKFSSENLSHTIDVMRIPMTILVICIHFNILCYPLVSHGEIIQYDTTWVQYPITFFSEIIGRLAVPFFFLTSGYFFFLKDTIFTKESYVAKLRKRFNSLFIPYVAWWIVAGVLTLIFAEARLVGSISILDFLFGLWCTPHGNLFFSTSINVPLDGPLWFLRDLMVTMILSPLIYVLIKDKFLGSLILTGCSLMYLFFGAFNLPQYFAPGLSYPCLLFFGWGALFGLHKINFLNLFYKIRLIIIPISVCLMALDLYLSSYIAPFTWGTHLEQNEMIHNAMILTSVPFCFLIGGLLGPKMQLSKKLSSSSFTIFALHKIIILPLGYIVVFIFHTSKEISATTSLLYYFGIIFLALLFGLVVYKIISMNKVLNKVLTGGR